MVVTRLRISLVTNMADEAGAVPAGLRRRFWRTAADVWRMVNGMLSLLSLCREVAGMTQATPWGGSMRKIAGPMAGRFACMGIAFVLALAFASASGLAIAQSGYPDKPIRI